VERTHGQHAPAAHDAHGAHDGHAHPGPRTYVKVAAILTLITLIEVAIFYIPGITNFLPLLITSFIVLSAFKFALVVMYFMHLKFDDVFFTRTFGFALLIALTIATAFIALFHGIYF
jgi:cytochrome c oxidase subunit 4